MDQVFYFEFFLKYFSKRYMLDLHSFKNNKSWFFDMLDVLIDDMDE